VLKVPFIRECGQQFINALVCILETSYILPGQYVLEQGSFGDEMYFIESGQLEVIVQGKVIKVLGDGVFFGGACAFCSFIAFLTLLTIL
jgi:CRP-like cAMP-binding protein